MFSLDSLFTLMTIIGLASSWFFALVIKPLNDKYETFDEMLKRITEFMEESNKDRRALEVRLAKQEEAINELKDRIDKIEGIWTK